MLAGAGAVATDALAPFVEDITPAVAIAGRLEVADLPGPRIEYIGAGGTEVAKRPPWRLERRAHRHALEHVQQAPRARLERPGRVVRVFRGEPVEHMDDEIGLVVAIGVFEPQHPRLVHHQHAAVEKLKARRAMELVVEDRTLVGLLVAVSVFEDHELVLRRRVAGQPLWITWHRGDPQSSLGIKRHLHRIGDLGKPRFIGKEPDLEALRHGAALDELFRRQNRRPALWVFTVGLPWLAKPGLRLEEVAGARIVGHRRHGLPGGEVPDPAVADCRHLADLHVLAGKRLRVPGAAAAIDIPAVDHPIVLQVHPRLVVDRRLERGKRLLIQLIRRRAKQRPVERFANDAVPRLVHMAAVDRVLHTGLGGKRLAQGVEQVDECDPSRSRDLASSVAVGREVRVLGVGIRQQGITRRLHGDRRHDHEPRRRLRVVARIGLGQIIEELAVVGLELRHTGWPGERLIESEEQQIRVGSKGGDRIIELRVVAGPLPVGHLVRRAGEVAKHELLAGKPLMKQRLEVAEQVHPLGRRVAEHGDPFAVDEFQRQAARGQRRPCGPRRNGEHLAGGLQRIGRCRLRLLFVAERGPGQPRQANRHNGSRSPLRKSHDARSRRKSPPPEGRRRHVRIHARGAFFCRWLLRQ